MDLFVAQLLNGLVYGVLLFLMAVISFGKTGRRCWPMRRVSSAFQTSSRKNVRGLKCLDGVKSLNERGNLRRGGAGRCETGFVIRHPYFNPFARRMKWKIIHALAPLAGRASPKTIFHASNLFTVAADVSRR